mmetsp:Transcript_27153/g.38912  ORF Transcript_27153/g.38912 Transcript_27153/m.38912 type:complete len:92 (-) Transcript_27153:653-928(-)
MSITLASGLWILLSLTLLFASLWTIQLSFHEVVCSLLFSFSTHGGKQNDERHTSHSSSTREEFFVLIPLTIIPALIFFSIQRIALAIYLRH